MNRRNTFILICNLFFIFHFSGVFCASADPLRQSGAEPEPTAAIVLENQIVLTEEDAFENEAEIVIETPPIPEGESDGQESAAEDDENVIVREKETEETVEDTEAVPAIPEIPVPENPKGELLSTAMGFYWLPVENAAHYEINWQNDRGSSEDLLLEADDWTCRAGRCILYAELPSDGKYTWTVSAVNDEGSSVSEEMYFSIPSLIPVPDTYRPNTRLNNQKPLTFEWEDTSSYNSAIPHIQAADVETDRIVMDVQYDPEGVRCMNGVCFLETDEYLPVGSYVWRIQKLNNGSASGWSSWTAFEVECTECNSGSYVNTVTAAVFPNGVTVEAEPQFFWKAVTGAQNYELEIKDSEERIVLDEAVPASACKLELCSYKPDFSFEQSENYSWSVITYGWNNSFWGLDSGMFSVVPAEFEPGEIHFFGAENNAVLDPDNPQLIWTDPGRTAAMFRVGIRDAAGEWLFTGDLTREDAWCDGLTCSIQFRTIPDGENYEFVVIPYSDLNVPGTPVTLVFSNLPQPDEE